MKKDRTALAVLKGLDNFARISRHISRNILKTPALSPIQLQFIEFIKNLPERHATVTILAEEFNLRKPTVSASIDNLVSKGFLKKEKSAADGRSSTLVITASGESGFDAIRRRNEIFTDAIGRLTDEEKRLVNAALMKIVKSVYEAGHVHPVRMCLNCANFADRASRRGATSGFCRYLNRFIGAQELTYDCPSHASE